MSLYVLITGCDSGFGRAAVDLILQQTQYKIFACFHTKFNQVVESTDRIVPIQLDITCDSSVEKMTAHVTHIMANDDASLVAIVNNAGGLVSAGPIEWTSLDTGIAQMNLNFFGTVRVTKFLLPILRRHQHGRVVIVSSILGLVASPFGGAYAASKFALEGWADCLRREMLPFGISIHLVEPGMFLGTNFYSQYGELVDDGMAMTPANVLSDYGGERYAGYCKTRLVRLRDFFCNINFHLVAHAILHALVSTSPRHRYRVGTDCIVFARILQYLPTCIADLAMTVGDAFLLGDFSLLPVLPNSSPFSHWTGMITWTIWTYNMRQLACAAFCIVILVYFIVSV